MTHSPRSSQVYFFVILLLTVGGIAQADVEYQGIVGPNPGGASFCLHPTTHVLTDSCGFIVRLESSQVDLSALVGQNMRVSGPDVGLECPVIDVQSATAVPVAGCLQLEGSIEVLTGGSPCSEPVSHVLLDGNCEPSLYLTDGLLLTALQGTSLQDLEGQRVVMEALDLSEPGCPLAEVQRRVSALDCPCSLERTLQVHDGTDTWLEWDPLPANCPVNYDVIRGFVWDLSQDSSQVDLSFVQCLLADTLQTSTFLGPRDTALPLYDDFFYYLVRAQLSPELSYGFSSIGLERHPFAGDCP